MSFKIIRESMEHVINNEGVDTNMRILSKALYDSKPLHVNIVSGQKYLSFKKTNISSAALRKKFMTTKYFKSQWFIFQRDNYRFPAKIPSEEGFAKWLLEQISVSDDEQSRQLIRNLHNSINCDQPANNTIVIRANTSANKCMIINLEDESQFRTSMMLLVNFPAIKIAPIKLKTPFEIWYNRNTSNIKKQAKNLSINNIDEYADQLFDKLSDNKRTEYIRLAADPLVAKWLADAYMLYCQISHNCRWMTIMPTGWQSISPSKRTYDVLMYFIPQGQGEYKDLVPDDYSQPTSLYLQWKYFLPYDVQVNLGRISSALFARLIQMYGETELATTDPTVPEMYRIMYRESIQHIVAPFLKNMMTYLRDLITQNKELAYLIRDHITLNYSEDDWYTPYVSHLVKLIDAKK